MYRLIRVESHWLANWYLITYGVGSDLTRKVERAALYIGPPSFSGRGEAKKVRSADGAL